MFNTLIPLSRELWPMIDGVMSSCCSHMTAAAVELATRFYTTTDTIAEIGTTSVTDGQTDRQVDVVVA